VAAFATFLPMTTENWGWQTDKVEREALHSLLFSREKYVV
jgi:hypothetical protein